MLKKFITILYLVLPLSLLSQVDVFEKNVYYSCFEKPLSEVLVDLSARTKVNIAFDPSIISEDYKISINIKNESLADVLGVILDDTNLEYRMLGGQIIITANVELTEEGKYTITGFIEDLSSGERLVYANIFSERLGIGTETNEYGYFSIETKDSMPILNFSYLGYEPVTLTLDAAEKRNVVSLTPNILLNEIIIEDTRLEKEPRIEDVNMLPTKSLNSMTSLGGEPDIMRLVGMQSGVSTGADGLGGLNVRGGSADQNLILLDGVPVYNTGHTLGMFSIFNSSMIKSTRLLKDAFPAKYGGRLSSVLDIRTKEGNMRKYAGEASLGTIASKFTIEGPIFKEKSAFIISARRSILDAWIAKASRSVKNLEGNDGELRYNFFDINAKVHFKMGENATFYINYYEGRDKFEDETIIENREDSLAIFENFESSWNWGNRIASARLSAKASEKLFLNSTLYYSRFVFDAFKNDQTFVEINFEPEEFVYDGSLFQTEIKDIGYRLDFDLNANNYNQLKFGFDAVRHEFNPGLLVVNEADSLIDLGEVLNKQVLKDSLASASEFGYEANIYIEDNIQATKYINIVLGARASLIRSRNENYYSLLPSIIVNTKLHETVLLRLTYSRMNQYLHLLSTSGLGLPTDIWLPTTDQLKPQKAWQLSGSLLTKIQDFGYFEIGGFYKKLSQILTLREGPIFDINQNNNWEFDIPTGEGLNYGFETSITKTSGPLKLSANYTWSKALRQFDGINNGEEYPFRYDRRHMLNSSASYRINKNIELSANGIYLKGNWVSLPTDFTSLGENANRVLFIYTRKNNVRLDDYIRFDVAFNVYNKYDWGRQKLTIGIYNVLNRANPLFYYFRRQDEDINKYDRKQISILPLLPSLSYSLSF